MRFHDLATAPAFVGFGFAAAGLRAAGLFGNRCDGAPPANPAAPTVVLDQHIRRMDRYGTIGLAAARAALSNAGMSSPSEMDAQWGLAVGSSLGCWSSNAGFYAELLRQTVTCVSPALFVRTVSNAVTGDVSIALRIGGTSETFVTGWTAGADAVVSAGAALSEKRARRMLAGGVEAPADLPPATFVLPSDRDWQSPSPIEGAGFTLLDAEAASDCLRLYSFWRGHDPRGRWSLRAALDATADLQIGAVVIANSVPHELLARWRDEAGHVPLIYLAERAGELGAVGTVVALAIAASRLLPGALVVSRGAEGCIVALAAHR